MPRSLPVRDLAEALAITGGLREAADEMLQELLAGLPAQLAASRTALAAQAWCQLREVVHHMKGGTAVCAVPALHAAVCHLQDAARAGNAAVARDGLATVEAEHARLAAAVSGPAPR